MLSPDDEFADFETWDKSATSNCTEVKTPEMLQYEYAREALKNGLKLESELGVNPYKFGMVGSDRQPHRSTPRRTISSASMPAPSLDRSRMRIPSSRPDTGLHDPWLAEAAAGYRRRLGDREHPRGDLRRHAAQGDLRHHRPAHVRALLRRLGLHRGRRRVRASRPVRLQKGVPMGGDLTPPEGKAPTFLVAALKDPIGGNLDRIQIVKGWLDARGQTQEKGLRRGLVGDRPPRGATASCRRSATRSTSRTRPGPTRSARRS